MNRNKRFLAFIVLIIAGSFAYSIGASFDLHQIQLFSNNLSSNEIPKQEGYSTNVLLSNQDPDAITCKPPINLSGKNIKEDQFTILWDDNQGTSWEYYIQEEGIGLPSSTGSVTVSTKEHVVKNDSQGNTLAENTNYEFYVRTICGSDSSIWAGPFLIRTTCKAFSVFPFLERFNSSSTTVSCWGVVDANNDVTSGNSNTWRISSSSTYEGDGVMYFQGNGKPNNDWLISPGFIVDSKKIYELSYYYNTSRLDDNEFEVLLSNNGRDITSFTVPLVTKQSYNNTKYQKKTIYITGYSGEIFIAWHVLSNGSSTIRIDDVSIEEVKCAAPIDVEVSGITKNSATISWQDDLGSTWESYVQPSGGGVPAGSGSQVKTKTITIGQTNGASGGVLQPNTEYEVYIRSKCDATTTSKWIGPIIFRTSCNEAALPFWEGFNTGSDLSCWRFIDNNLDGEQWKAAKSPVFEGDGSMSYAVYSIPADDYLVTPGFLFDATKMYRLKFNYRTSPNFKSDFEVLMSSTGTAPTDFKTNLLSKKDQSSVSWKEEKVIVSGVNGVVYFAWHANGKTDNYIYIDNVYIEEISCSDPTGLDVKNIKDVEIDLQWKDAYGKKWEYVVQKPGKGEPTTNGTATTSTSNTVDKNQEGDAIQPNTSYEYYVRTDCGGGVFSDWSGPFFFTTICSNFDVPYWEGFNSDSKSFDCWTILDINDDGDEYSGKWNMDSFRPYEGDGLISFKSYSGDDTNDWLISPTFNLKAGKLYRLKFHYKANANNKNAEFVVLASNSGIDPKNFTKEIVKKQKYVNHDYLERTVFIDNFSGAVNFAWYVEGTDTKSFSLDNVFVEEVVGCPEPIDLKVDKVTSNSAELSWTDDFKATNWQFYIQEVGETKPDAKTKGENTTSKIANNVTVDAKGNKLRGNTDYEFYVRTACGDGTFSIWSGPFVFTTLCEVYNTPYWEGFNSDSVGYRCWDFQKYDGSASYFAWNLYGGVAYEGDSSIRYYKVDDEGEYPSDAWAITPAIKMTTDTYVLKYNYQTDKDYENNFEVKLSATDRNPNSFTTVLVPETSYSNGEYEEKVVFFTGVAADVFIGWHATTVETSYIYIDNVSIKKVENCPEPYYIEVTNQTTNGFDLTWQQNGGVTSWEIIVVNYGEDETATPVVTTTVTGTPTTTITGLDPATLYTVYIRAKCDATGTKFSDWSTSAKGVTKVGANDECAGALNIPVNKEKTCDNIVKTTLFGATTSSIALPTCNGSLANDIWFEFTATASTHALSVSDFIGLSGTVPTINFVLYDVACGAMTNTAVECFSLSEYNTSKVFKGLTPGKQYYLRVGTSTNSKSDVMFNLCITSPSFLKITESDIDYTVQELVEEVLVSSNCDLVSNITWISGNQFANDNSIGYFDKNNSDFVFENGIILATNGVKYGMGPGDDFNEGDDTDQWIGDDDLDDLLVSNNRDPYSINATVLEFDFIPVVDSLKFDFIFASNEYGTHQCDYSDVFAFFLTDLTTGEVSNLAVVPGTETPISVTTIKDMKYNRGCASSNVEYFDKFYGNAGLPEYENPINYKGMTVPLIAKSKVIPGRKYHIKMAIADYQDNQVNSAVFLRGGSFNLGNLDLGKDLLIETGNAICDQESILIKSGINTENDAIGITWYKDGEEIVGENNPDLEVVEAGDYKIVAVYESVNCEVTGEIKVEMFPAIHTIVKNPTDIEVCRMILNEVQVLDLTQVESIMFTPEARENYITTYFEDSKEGEQIEDAKNYKSHNTDKEIFILVEDSRTGCTEYFSFSIKPVQGVIPVKPEDVVACESYTLPLIKENERYYSEKGGKGKQYKSGDLLEAGDYTMYLLSDNGNGCYEEVSFSIQVTPRPVLQELADVEIECAYFVLPELLPNNKYFIDQDGQRIEVMPGTTIYETGTIIYIVAESENKICHEETSFTITYLDCPIPKGFSPNGDGINDTFDLSNHGVSSIKIFNRNGMNVYAHGGGYTKQWDGKDKSGNQLPSGTYYYVIEANHKTRTGWVEINR